MQKKLLVVLGFLVFLVGLLFFIPAKPEFPVEYSPLSGINDYINGNATAPTDKRENFLKAHLYGWNDWTKESAYPLITEDDWVIVMIDSGQQTKAWGIEYSKQELLEIAQQELGLAEKQSDSWSYKKSQIARIRSFIDVLSRR